MDFTGQNRVQFGASETLPYETFLVEKLMLGPPDLACFTLRVLTSRIFGLFSEVIHVLSIVRAEMGRNRLETLLKMKKLIHFPPKCDSKYPYLLQILDVSLDMCPNGQCQVPLASTALKLYSSANTRMKTASRRGPEMPSASQKHQDLPQNRNFL